MAGWHHRLNGHELGQTLGGSEGQGGLVCCSPWGHKESDTTEQLNNNNTPNPGLFRAQVAALTTAHASGVSPGSILPDPGVWGGIQPRDDLGLVHHLPVLMPGPGSDLPGWFKRC